MFSQAFSHFFIHTEEQVPVGNAKFYPNVHTSAFLGVLTLILLVINVILPVHSRTLTFLR